MPAVKKPIRRRRVKEAEEMMRRIEEMYGPDFGMNIEETKAYFKKHPELWALKQFVLGDDE